MTRPRVEPHAARIKSSFVGLLVVISQTSGDEDPERSGL
jgi:hypothetical protein